jgi:prephenate dehydrogenase
VVKEISDMWKSAGAKIMEIDSVKHDITVAHTSHVPHIVASILTLTALKDGKTRAQRENGCAGGFRDTTRIASSAPQMWREIIENNRAAVLKTLFEFEKNLKSFRENISKAEYSELEKKLQSAKDLRDSWLSKKN